MACSDHSISGSQCLWFLVILSFVVYLQGSPLVHLRMQQPLEDSAFKFTICAVPKVYSAQPAPGIANGDYVQYQTIAFPHLKPE